MHASKTSLVYFSPTRTTQAVVRAIGAGTGLPVREYDATHLSAAPATPTFSSDDIVVLGFPVYMGRIPVAALGFLEALRSEGSPCILVGVYGNRAFDDFLVELEDIARARGFLPIAAAAFLGEHSITKALATGRPDERDLSEAEEFGRAAAAKLAAAQAIPVLPEGRIPGKRPYATYSASKNGKVTTEKLANGPTVNENCIECKRCVAVCPIDNINPENVRDINPYECIRCHACVRNCPTGAIQFLKPGFLRHIKDLEDNFSLPRKTPTIVV